MAGIVTLFESTDAGAPTLNNAVGSLIAVLDACLITGYNTKAVTSITVASGVATVVCAGHGFSNIYGKIVRHAGATPAGLNIDARIANVTTNGYTYLCPSVADGVATGTITAKYAPMDWTKQFSGTNKAMYKRGDVAANGCMLRVDDTVVGQDARSLMVQTASGIDTYTNSAPTSAQVAGGLGQYWSKGYNSAVAADWFVVADGLQFFLFVKAVSGTYPYVACGFGDIPSFRVSDTLNCMLAGGSGPTNAGAPLTSTPSPGALLISGGKDGTSISQTLSVLTRDLNYGTNGSAIPYPSTVDGGLVIQYPILLVEPSVNGSIRGVFSGLAVPLAYVQAALPSRTQISNVVGGVTKVFLLVHVGQQAGSSAVTCAPLIDLTGPWR